MFESVLAPGAISDQPFFVIQGSKGEIVLNGFDGGGALYTEDGRKVFRIQLIVRIVFHSFDLRYCFVSNG